MASLSWLFGRKKSAGEGPSATVSPRTFEETESFVNVDSTTFLYPTLDNEGSGVSGTPVGNINNLPYDVQAHRLDDHSKKPPLLSSDSLPNNPLHDIPFKLNSQLQIDVTDLEVFLFNVNSALTKAVHVNENVIKYNFSNERSVISEEQCSINDYN